MGSVLRSLTWFYHEFGVDSLGHTGRNAYCIIAARTLRMFAYGTNSLILAIFFNELGFSDFQIGAFMTLTLLGDVVLGIILTLIADRVGRRRILLLGSLLMITSGLAFAIFENFWLLLIAAIVGVISATGGDFGPFRSIEESILSQLTDHKTRADVLAWYVTISGLGSAVGSEASGRILHYLQNLDGWHDRDAYHALFWLYTAMGIVNALLTCCLTRECELETSKEASYAQVAQDEQDGETDEARRSGSPNLTSGETTKTSKIRVWSAQMLGSLSQISASTRSTMYKLWFLLAIDSIADGMVPYSLTNYYVDEKFHPKKATLGDITSAAYFLGAVSAVFASPLARRIGLINTMVFTHIPSSAAVLIFPLPGNLFLTTILLLIRAGLNPMDQAPRSAFIAAVVRPEERTAVMGITAMLRTLAAMLGPSITGILAGSQRFWIAFVAGGALRLTYDLGLYVMFRSMKVDGSQDAPKGPSPAENAVAGPDDFELTGSGSSSDDEYDELENDSDVRTTASRSK